MLETAATIDPPSKAVETADRKLRVALVTGNYNYVLDGAARVQNLLVAHLLERGHQALILAPTGSEPAFRHAGTVYSVPSVRLPGKRGEYRLGLGLSRGARARLDAFSPDLIQIGTPDLTGITALNFARSRGIPAVASFHTRFDRYPRYYGAAWLEKYLTRYMRWFYSRCVHVYVPTPSMLEVLRRDGIGRELRLWRRGVDCDAFDPRRRDNAWRRGIGILDDEVVIAFVGRIVFEKGIDQFAEAVRIASEKNPKIRALVVGDGPERVHLEDRLPEGVFVGHRTGDELARAYASADIFFNPSITETAGNVTLEAMASGLCCIAAAAPGTKSYVQHGRTGILVPPEAPASDYADSLLLLSGDAGLRKRMGSTARASAKTEHCWPQIFDELLGHYRDAIETFKSE